MKELKDTVDGMLSSDYKERFKAEYEQLKIRYDKLDAMLTKWNKGELDFVPTCPKDILEDQIIYMYNYLDILQRRAEIENIEL